MMWLLLAFMSAALLGFYDSFKKQALMANAVLPVLFLSTLFSALVFMPLIIVSHQTDALLSTPFQVGGGSLRAHACVVVKSCIVLVSWLLGYFGLKHLPLTIVGPINATRPVMVLIGALIVFGERLNGWQWAGVLLAALSFLLLSRSGRREGIRFGHNRWIWMIVGSAAMGAVSGLYDKYLLAPVAEGGLGLDRMMVQSWFAVYQCLIMALMMMLLWWPRRHQTSPFHWSWAILGVSLFLSAADFVYFYSLSLPGAMISIVSMVRRGSVVVSFLFGAVIFHEKNLRAKAFDLALVLIGMVFLYIGSR